MHKKLLFGISLAIAVPTFTSQQFFKKDAAQLIKKLQATDQADLLNCKYGKFQSPKTVWGNPTPKKLLL